MKVLILGISGWIGSSLHTRLQTKGVDVAGSWCHTMPPHPVKGVQFNQMMPEPLYKFIKIWQPDVVVNALEGLTDDAFRLHAQLCKSADEGAFKYVYVSTAASLERSADKTEKAEAKAKSRYGQFKASCEKLLNTKAGHLLVRTGSCHGVAPHKNTRTTDFLSYLQAGEALYFPDNLTQNHISIDDFSLELSKLIIENASGIKHILGAGPENELLFRRRLAKAFGYDEQLVQCGQKLEKDIHLDSADTENTATNNLIDELVNMPALQEYICKK